MECSNLEVVATRSYFSNRFTNHPIRHNLQVIMAAPSKKKPAPAPEIINQYGFKQLAIHSQLTYDMMAFGHRLPVDSGAPPRPVLFRRIADQILPGYFEWHDWSKAIVEAGCGHSLIGNPGCSNCVSGETRILNPITGEQPTIQWLCENQIAPIVQTLEGPCRAGVPFVKGVEQLYEISTDNGLRFEATAGHRVLVSSANANHYVRVGDLRSSDLLLGYEPSLLPSISERAPLIRVEDALCSQKKVEGFLVSCCPYSRLDGEQPHLEEDNAQSFSPSRDDVPKRTQDDFCEGVQETRFSRSHSYPQTFPLSIEKNAPLETPLDILAESHFDLGTSSHAFRLSRLTGQFRSTCSHLCPSGELYPGFDNTHHYSADSFETHQPNVVSSFSPKVAPIRVVSIRATRIAQFYDISVPGPNHYFAEGSIHHNSGKTHHWAGFAVAWWLCYPEQSSVMFVSTSIKSLRRRGWAQIQKCFGMTPGDRVGNFVDSRMMWQAVKGDDKHAIIGKAVEEGSTHKVADDIKGVHTKRQMVIVDEANAVPEAIWEAITNLYSYPKEFILIALANPRDRLSKFSRFIEPLDGWTSVDVNTEEWDGKPQKEYGNIPVKVIRFDAEKSPNIIEGKLVSKHLPTREKVDAAKASGGGETPSYWTNFRGFPPPEGLNKTVFSESALIKNDAFGKHTFTGKNFQIVGAFDPAFGGGDRPALRFAKIGMIEGDKWGIEVAKPVILPINPHSTNPVHFQLTEALRRLCETVPWGDVTYSCPPENLGVDATGEGGGLCDIIQRTWSSRIIRIEFGGRPSEDSASLEDVRPASEVYENKAVEMWFRSRDAVNAGQLRGIDPETSIELTNRLFDDEGKRIKLQKKKDYKEMFGRSPDFADCLVMILEVARRKGFRLAATGQTVAKLQDWSALFNNAQSVYAAEGYQEEEYDYA